MVKKVAVIYAGARYWGGVENYLENLFKYIDPKEIELHYISLGEWELGKKIPGNKLLLGSWHNPTNFFKLKKYLKKNNINLIISQGMVGAFYARKATFLTGIPNVTVIHSDWRQDYSCFKKVMFWVFDRLLRKLTKRYIAVSNYLKEKMTQEGINPKKIEVVYNGVDFRNNGERNIEKIIKVGSIGRLHPVKNYENLIKAISIFPELTLEIVGEGQERQSLENLVSKLGLEDRVSLLGEVKDVYKKFNDWDLYIQPSLTEGFGLSVVEAMGAGLPVIVTPGGALKELVKDTETGFVSSGFKDKEITGAISLAKEDIEKTLIIAEQGKSFVHKEFEKNNFINKTAKVILEVTS